MLLSMFFSLTLSFIILKNGKHTLNALLYLNICMGSMKTNRNLGTKCVMYSGNNFMKLQWIETFSKELLEVKNLVLPWIIARVRNELKFLEKDTPLSKYLHGKHENKWEPWDAMCYVFWKQFYETPLDWNFLQRTAGG